MATNVRGISKLAQRIRASDSLFASNRAGVMGNEQNRNERERKVNFDLVEERVREAKAIAWDTCHKIYLLMDDEQVELMRGYGYDPIITAGEATPDEMLRTLVEWYEDSCGLRFIDAVSTNHDDPNDGFEILIPQIFEGASNA